MPDAVSQHAAILAKLDGDPPRCAGDPPWFCGADEYKEAVRALRAVVELHRPAPGPFAVTTGEELALCYGCSHHRWASPIIAVGWFDCLTIKAVAGALGVDLNG